jgi:hypothetical protein
VIKRLDRYKWLFLALGSVLLCLLVMPPHKAVSDTDDYQVFFPFISSARPYSFFVAGHTYGVPGADFSGPHPPFREFFPQINASHLDFGLFTGDIVTSGTPENWDTVDATLAELTAPVHFVVGNHDMSNRSLFVSRYGPTYYSFEYMGDLFVVLDGELNWCNILGEQMTFLQQVLDGTDAENVFVFVHRLIWIAEDTPYYILHDKINSSNGYNFQSNFWPEVEPLLRSVDAQVYLIAGDVGVSWAMPLFYERYDNVTFIASGMGGAEEENFLIFDVNSQGVQIQVQRLDGQPLSRGAIEAYNLAYYSQ